jgi:hypothetical protein
VSVAPLFAQADLEVRFTPKRILQLADDANTNSLADAGVVAVIANTIVEASAIMLSILRTSWSSEQVAILVAEDPAVKGAGCDIAISLLARRRQEFDADGTPAYTRGRKAAEDLLKRFADREQNPDGARIAGQNQTIGTNTNRPARALIFQGNSTNNRGPGGF